MPPGCLALHDEVLQDFFANLVPAGSGLREAEDELWLDELCDALLCDDEL